MTLVVLAIVGFAVGVVAVYLALRQRQARSLEDNLRNFRRGLEALDPENDPLKNRRNGRGRS